VNRILWEKTMRQPHATLATRATIATLATLATRATLAALTVLATLAATLALQAPAQAQTPASIKLGLIIGQSGPFSVAGAEQKRGFDIAMAHLGGKLGGIPVEVVQADSKGNPGATVQELSRLIERDHVNLVTGLTASNEIIAAIKPITDAKVIFVGMNGGPAQIAGAGCSPYYFNASFQNAQITNGIGAYMSQHGVHRLYLIGMDYEAGHEHTDAARKGFTGELVAQSYTPLNQLDFAADIAKIRASGADGVFAFYPGGPGIAFVRQWAQAGLSGKIPLYSNIALSEPTVFQAQGKSALGIVVSGNYASILDNPQNARFVQDFRSKFGRDPASFAGLAYDTMMLIDAAVREAGPRVQDPAALRAALKHAQFQSIRGPFRFNTNQQPIQNNYVFEVAARPDGSLYLKQVGTAAENAADEYASQCNMK
jgi:branched-chain amino acid transport system substrate-binding protein